MNDLSRNITNNLQNITNHVIKWSLQKFLLSNIKNSLIGFKISITKRVIQKRKLSRVTFSHNYGCFSMIHIQCILNYFYQRRHLPKLVITC